MSNEHELPPLPPEEQARFDAEVSGLSANSPIRIGTELPGLGRMVPVNLDDPTPRQRVLLGIMGRALRERREAEERGEQPPSGFF